jgi:hypothetical protein
LACGKGTRRVVKTTAHIAATCARRRGCPLDPRQIYTVGKSQERLTKSEDPVSSWRGSC